MTERRPPPRLSSSFPGAKARSAAGAEELRAMRAAAWHRQGLAVLHLADVRDDFARQAIVNECNRLYGKRRTTP